MSKQDPQLSNNLKQIRLRLGMSQQDLANLVGVSRQTIGGIESQQYAPSTTVALRLAKALGCQVEDLFWLEEDIPEITAIPTQFSPKEQNLRFSLARIQGNWVAHPLIGNNAFRLEMIPADGEGVYTDDSPTVKVKLLKDLEQLEHTVVLAGCTPAISLWARAAELWHRELRVHWTFENSMNALSRLSQGEVHLAGVHLYDQTTKEYNIPFVKSVLGKTPAVVINLGSWEEGLLIQSGNPFSLHTVADLQQPGVRIVNRELGSGSRQVLERSLLEKGIDFNSISGFDNIVFGHLEVAQAVLNNQAVAGVSTASVARAFGLDFLPLQRSRYDLVILKSYLDESPIQQLLSTLGHRRVLSQLQAIGGYDISQTGEIMAVLD